MMMTLAWILQGTLCRSNSTVTSTFSLSTGIDQLYNRAHLTGGHVLCSELERQSKALKRKPKKRKRAADDDDDDSKSESSEGGQESEEGWFGRRYLLMNCCAGLLQGSLL